MYKLKGNTKQNLSGLLNLASKLKEIMKSII